MRDTVLEPPRSATLTVARVESVSPVPQHLHYEVDYVPVWDQLQKLEMEAAMPDSVVTTAQMAAYQEVESLLR